MAMVATVVPAAGRLPDVLPTARLSGAGRPAPEIRERLRRIPMAEHGHGHRGVGPVVRCGRGSRPLVNRWWAYLLAFFLMGRAFALLNILAHEAAHRLLFSHRRINDLGGRWLLAYPAFMPFDLYRRSHMAHHRDEMGPEEPDLGLYSGYPISRASMRRKLLRDAVGISGWKNLAPLLRAADAAILTPAGLSDSRRAGGHLGRVLAGEWQVVALPGAVAGPVDDGLAGPQPAPRHRRARRHGTAHDRRRTTHVVRQRPFARFWMVPYHTGWHLAHHVDSGIPWRRLPELHRELVAAGWITPELEYPSYFALWRALASGSR